MRAIPHLLIYLVPALVAGVVAGLAWQRRYYRGGRPFVLLMLAICWWNICHAISIIDPSFEGTLFWSLLQYLGIVLVGPAWLLLALAYSGQWWRTDRWVRLAIFAPELLLLLVALTNSVHGLWWPSVQPDTSRGFMWLSVTRGPAFWVHSAYAYLCVLIGAVLLARASLSGAPTHRYHARLMLIACLIPAVGNLTFIFGLRVPWNDDPTPLTLLASGIMAFYATMRYRLVDLAPLAEREIMAGLPDGLVVLDSQGFVADVNALAPALLGVPAGRWAGRPLAVVAAGSPFIADLRAFLAGPPTARSRQVLYPQGGELRAVELRLLPLLASNGAASGALLLLRDVSERARVDQDRARHLAEISLISQVARTANSAVETERLIHSVAEAIVAGQIWERVSVALIANGGSRFSIAVDLTTGGAPSYEGALAHAADVGELSGLLRSRRVYMVEQGDPLIAGTTLRATMRAAGLCSLLIVPLYHQEAPLGLLALGSSRPGQGSPALTPLAETIGELITDALVRARLYEEVRQADRLKASFLATMSHELRTPLTAIIGYTDMLQKGIYGPPGERMAEPLSHMRHSGLTLLRLINDILDFSRMEAGHLKVDLMPVDLRRTLRDVVGQLGPQISERGLELGLEIGDELPPVRANPQRLEQVIANLVGNAIKFTDSGSITVSARAGDSWIEVSVRDTGVGIAPEHLEAIFQEFRRVDAAGGRRPGAGLGLAICRRLLGLMGGSISVVSAVGAGSTFTIRLPLAELGADPALALRQSVLG